VGFLYDPADWILVHKVRLILLALLLGLGALALGKLFDIIWLTGVGGVVLIFLAMSTLFLVIAYINGVDL